MPGPTEYPPLSRGDAYRKGYSVFSSSLYYHMYEHHGPTDVLTMGPSTDVILPCNICLDTKPATNWVTVASEGIAPPTINWAEEITNMLTDNTFLS